MDKKILAAGIVVLLAIMSVMCMPATFAVGEGQWITSYTIEDSQTGQVLIEADFAQNAEPTVYAPVLAGQQLKVTFTVNVFTSGSGNLRLTTEMSKPIGPYWELASLDYDLGSGYTPNSASITFNWAKGTFTMICYGKVSQVSKPTNIAIVKLSGATGDVLDAIEPLVLTAGADAFQNLYDQKEARLQSLIDSGVAAGYTQMYQNILDQSEALVAKGYVNEAIALLNSIPNSGEPMGTTMEMILYPLIAVAGVAAALFAVMFIRARGKNSYFKLVVEDQIKDLEGLTLRASKIDRTMSSSLDSIKDRLKRLVGM